MRYGAEGQQGDGGRKPAKLKRAISSHDANLKIGSNYKNDEIRVTHHQ
jgi:hypothetical protein